MSIHPITTTEHLRDQYIRYLKTIYSFQDNRLRKQFSEAIESPEALVKGPILEASPPFVGTVSIKNLVDEGVLSSGFPSLCSDHLPYERELYSHQEEAIRKIVAGRNVVVSTGTGSGKTESFLIPILNRLLLEQERGTLSKSGVRAMLLYPLNALANDQVKRLRRILMYFPQITFGRYIGETSHKKKDAEEQFAKIYPEEPRIPNELLSRDEMQAAPPHIFLTNYAMLEYLLLRPADSVFFDGQTASSWSFIVLDEAHIYDGALANEIGMLIRRVEQRILGDDLGGLQGIATSATIGGGQEDYSDVVKFAQNLFNLPFEWDDEDIERRDVVGASRLPISSLGDVWGTGTPRLYRELADMADAWRNKDLFTPPDSSTLGGIPPKIRDQAVAVSSTPIYLYELLRGDQNLQFLRTQLELAPQNLSELAETIFPDQDIGIAENAVSDLVSAAVLARDELEESPLLPARYHVFAKALEGAFICLNTPSHQEDDDDPKPNLFLTRQRKCPHCGSQVFELANCTLCGKTYLIGEVKPNKQGVLILEQNSTVYDAIVTEKDISYFALKHSGGAAINEDAEIESQNMDEEIGPVEDLEQMELCPDCGSVRGEFDLFKCSCEADPIPLAKIHLKKTGSLQRCVGCSTRSNRGVVYRFLTGQDPPVSVLVDALYEHLPGAKDERTQKLPGNGRKLLNFTDSRQKAAFFAPFVERTHMRDLRRQLIIQTLLNDPAAKEGKLRLPDVVTRIAFQAEQKGVFHQDLSHDARNREVAIWLMKEFSPLDRRISLEGVGLLGFAPAIDLEWQMPDFLADEPWKFTKEDAEGMILLLLRSIRMNGAITYLRSDLENLVADEDFAPRNKTVYLRGNQAAKGRGFNIISWNPALGYSNARLDLLTRYLTKRDLPEDVAREQALVLLQELWVYISSEYSPWSKLLLKSDQGQEGVLYQIRHDLWYVIPSGLDDWDAWYICDTCLNMFPHNAGGVCGTFGCQGKLISLRESQKLLQDNLYRDAYVNGEPIPLAAEEHTAQWVTRKAAEVQNSFIQGKINLLSCSTTFELGVDVGDLQSVVMRNVPPSTANYVQRAGRAGRRTDAAALALTFAQRRPHDLSHFKDPKRMVSGEIKPPVTILHNDKIVRRHIYSVVFAAFLRWAKEKYDKEYFNLGSFYEPDPMGESGADLLRDFLARRQPGLLQAIQQVLPREGGFTEIFSLDEWGWIEGYTNQDRTGVFDNSEKDYQQEISEFQELLDIAVKSENYPLAGRYQRIQKQIKNRRLFD
jgi:hypothetical protein